MDKTKLRALPDAINCSITRNFTIVPNEFIRNPEISAKAKTILSILLSNRQGWHSCVTSISTMMREGASAIKAGLSELEDFEYLIRIRYRRKEDKVLVGSFWSYTDTPNQFNIIEHLDKLSDAGLEPLLEWEVEPDVEKPHVAEPHVENHSLIIPKGKKEKNINKSSGGRRKIRAVLTSNGVVTRRDFKIFWELYPIQQDEGAVLTAWHKICNRLPKDRPKLKDIKMAIHKQRKTQRWKEGFIPNPTTWLNQKRWLDDPAQMDKNRPKGKHGNKSGSRAYDSGVKRTQYREADEEITVEF